MWSQNLEDQRVKGVAHLQVFVTSERFCWYARLTMQKTAQKLAQSKFQTATSGLQRAKKQTLHEEHGETLSSGRGEAHSRGGEGVVGVFNETGLDRLATNAVRLVCHIHSLILRKRLIGAATHVATHGRHIPCLLLCLCSSSYGSSEKRVQLPFRHICQMCVGESRCKYATVSASSSKVPEA